MKSPNELSFLPDDYLERKAQRRTNAICATLFMVVMVAIGSAFTYTERSMRAVEREHISVEKHYTDAAKRIQQVQQLQDKQRTMAMQAELTASLLEKVPRSFLLAEITNSMPRGVSLLDMALESKKKTPSQSTSSSASKSTFEKKSADAKKKPSGAAGSAGNAQAALDSKPPEVSIKITGIAGTDVQVAQFITRLNQSKLLKDVNLIISDEYKDSDEASRKFQIEMIVDPLADVASIAEKPKVTAVEITK